MNSAPTFSLRSQHIPLQALHLGSIITCSFYNGLYVDLPSACAYYYSSTTITSNRAKEIRNKQILTGAWLYVVIGIGVSKQPQAAFLSA